MKRQKLVLVGLVLTAICFALPVGAEERDRPAATTSSVPTSDIAVRGYVLGFGNDETSGGGIGGLLTSRTGFFEAGGFAEAGGGFLDYGYTALGGAAGLGWRSESGVRLAALGTVGSHHYTGYGRGFLSNDPGANATLPFAGGRVHASYRVWRGLDIGLMGLAEKDLEHRTVRYSYMEESWFGNGSYRQDEKRDVGTTTYGLGLQVGGTLDL